MRDTAPVENVFHGAVRSIRSVWANRQLLHLLVRREIRAKYKDSVLGLAWSLIRPLIQLGIYYVVMGWFMGLRDLVPNFAIFIYSGITIWSLFQEIINSGTGSILANAGIVKKTQLPREIFPLASVGSALFNFVIQLIILVVAVIATGGVVGYINFLHFPLAVAVVLVWSTALALLLAALNVYFRDIQYLTEVALMIGFYASPIIYAWTFVQTKVPQWFLEIYLANPITLSIMGTQRVLWNSGVDFPYPSNLALRLLVALVVGLILLAVCHRVFLRLQRNFAQEM